MPDKKLIIGGSIGNCVHVAGILEYFKIAEKIGYKTHFLGAQVSPEMFVEAIKTYSPDIVCISYRLTAEVLEQYLGDFFRILNRQVKSVKCRFYFGGTRECVEVARKYNYFTYYFQGEEDFSYIAKSLFETGEYNSDGIDGDKFETGNYISRSTEFYYPILRHHFGLPSLEKTIEGIKEIAEAGVVDIISLAPDQNAQEFFFESEKMDSRLDGAGGTPIRTENDLERIMCATQRGNNPRLKIYSGTRNLLKWAEMSVRILNNVWGTIPLFWYSELDGRSTRLLDQALKENMDTIKWYAQRGLPVEINDSHQWGLRECSDVISVADMYIAAYNAKKLGVHKYIAQFMFNTPRLTTGKMDLAKMLASCELLDELTDESFTYLKQVRAGLTHFSTDLNIAKGQLAASTLLAIALRPQIIHVVSYSEADHAAQPEDVIESCKIVKGVLRNCWVGFPDLTKDEDVINRKNQLKKDAKSLLDIIREYYKDVSLDPLSDPACLESMVKEGILDAPHLKGNSVALGNTKTLPVNGGYENVDEYGQVISDVLRIGKLIKAGTNNNELNK